MNGDEGAALALRSLPESGGRAGTPRDDPFLWGPLLIIPSLRLSDPVEPGARPPIRAWKVADTFEQVDGQWRFVPTTDGAPYLARDVATCSLGHRVPEPSCRCGFYAVNDGSTLSLWSGGPILEVDLFGRVLVGEKGYRAERQLVRRIVLPTCKLGRRCAGEIGLFVVRGQKRPELLALCESCADRESVLSTVEDVLPISPREAHDLLGAPVVCVPDGVKGVLLGGPPSMIKHFLVRLGLAPGSAGNVPGKGERFLIDLAADAARGYLKAGDVKPYPKGWHAEALTRFLSLPERLAAIESRLERLEHPGTV